MRINFEKILGKTYQELCDEEAAKEAAWEKFTAEWEIADQEAIEPTPKRSGFASGDTN